MTGETSNQIWADDKLRRREDADFLIKFLLGRVAERTEGAKPSNYVLNIDAGWGQGKSFFIDRFRRELEARDICVAHVNAWVDDHAADPLLPVMAAIEAAITPLIETDKAIEKGLKAFKRAGATIVVTAGKGALKQLSKRVFGEAAEALADSISDAKDAITASKSEADDAIDKLIDKKAEEIISDFKRSQRSMEEFKRELGQIICRIREEDKNFVLFVVIDELDRCRPNYAISMLERIKHLFDVDRVIFIIATDTEQLSHSISGLYGHSFNGQLYLGRFFDRTYSFPSVSRRAFIERAISERELPEAKLSIPGDRPLEDFLPSALSCFELSLRDTDKCIDLLSVIATIWDRRAKIELAVLIPLIGAYQSHKRLTINDGHELKRLFDREACIIALPNPRERFSAHDPVLVSLADLALELWTAGDDLTGIYGAETASASRIWVQRRLGDEYALEHQNSSRAGVPLPSLIRKYPELVKSAGRLRAGEQ
jgi:hypothetical protein